MIQSNPWSISEIKIDTVIVDVRMVVQDGEIPGIDLDKLAIEANKVN